ncbi:MAG: YjjG family noncanonical pyrimidine nucleotidase [Bacteroidota bacterium]
MFHTKQHLFFDLDHTLWDYESCSAETLTELWTDYQLESKGVVLNNFLKKFEKVNANLWDQFHAGEIDKDVIRNDRFPTIFDELEIQDNGMANEMQHDYITVCPTKPHLIDGAKELLDYLEGRYKLHIITNGFDEIQGVKLNSGGLSHYFDVIVTSSMANSQKPNKQIFDYAVNKAGATIKESLMIGDNPESDIEGAYLAGIDQVFYNPNNFKCPITPTLEIRSLLELKKYL